MKRVLLPLLLMLAPALSLEAQAAPELVCPSPSDPSEIDRVVAVVGDSVILFTDLQRECELARAEQLPVTLEEVLDNLINVQVLLQHAARDSTVLPTDEELDRRVQAQVDTVRARSFPTDAAFQQALAEQGLTLATYREQLRATIRSRLIRDAYMRRLLQQAPTPIVSEAEMRAFFDDLRARGELQMLPELVTIQQVLIRSQASDEAWARAQREADSLYALILRGADFAELARTHSDDSTSAVQGGELGWVPRGQTVPEFERAFMALRDGGVSVPVRTEYGYHIIRVERSRPGEKFVRHILVMPEMASTDLDRTRALGEEIADRIRAGESALRLAQTYGEPSLPRELRFPRGQEAEAMPAEFAQRVVGAQEGQVIGPFDALLVERNYVAVLYVSEVRAAGELTFEDARDQIRTLLAAQKRQDRVLEDLREKTFVEVRYDARR